jgi:hypothetical protein
MVAAFLPGLPAQTTRTNLPAHVPPKRSSQIQNGFGINSDLPREPYLPWNRWWWTRMFDAGVSWIRIGQYENSSDPTSWDWVEQRRGVFAVAPEVDDYVDSLVENGVQVQVQLMYGNPMYTSRSGIPPDIITPEPGSFHNDDRSINSIFWPPKTPDQIAAFLRYVKWMVNHFRGRIHYYALWNEQDIGYWNPYGNPEEYGRLLAAFVPAVHETDPLAKVIYGGQADPTSDFAKRALVRNYPGIRKDIEFWDDEFNSIPSWRGSDESVQAKYIPRGMIYNHAAGVKTFVWLLTAGVDGNEYDDFGFIHGKRNLPDDFTPRPVYYALQNTDALFSDTKLDPRIALEASDVPNLRRQGRAQFLRYGFRNKNGKSIIAYWVAAHSVPGGAFPPLAVTMKLRNTGIREPVLIDVVSGEITALEWKRGTTDTLEALPLRDSILAIADASYFDWPILPEAPSGLVALPSGAGPGVELHWELHDGQPSRVAVERRIGNSGRWERIATQPAPAQFSDTTVPRGSEVCYRVRAMNDAGESAYSNIARIKR